MRLSPDEKAYISLTKETEILLKYANRPNAPLIEQNYYRKMASITLEKAQRIFAFPRKKPEQQKEYER